MNVIFFWICDMNVMMNKLMPCDVGCLDVYDMM